MISMEQVATEAGVSKATVSRVLAGNVRVVPETRDRVMSACRRLNYKPNPNIQDLIVRSRSGATRNLAYVLVGNDFSNPGYVRLLDGISAGANFHRYHLMLVKLSGEERDVYDLPTLLRDERIDGILLSGNLTPEVITIFIRLGIPCVVLGNYDMALLQELSSVQLNIPAMMNGFVGELKATGSRKIAFAIEDIELYSHRVIFDAFVAALKAQGLPWDPTLGYFGNGPLSGVYDLLRPVFAAPELPFDTIFCPDYREAMEISHLIVAREGAAPSGGVRLAGMRPYDYYRLPVPAHFAGFDMAGLARPGIDLLVDLMKPKGNQQKTVFI